MASPSIGGRSSVTKSKSSRRHAPTPLRLLLRVHTATNLAHTALSQGVYCKLYVGETAMTHGSQRNLFGMKKNEDTVLSYDKKDSCNGSTTMTTSTHRIFRTTTSTHADAATPVLWDENFDVLVMDARHEILSIRVKSKHYLYPSVLGVCAIPLKQLKMGRKWDQCVPLLKGNREVANLRVQLLLSPLQDTTHKTTERTQGVLQADCQTARAANHAADEAIDRLLSSATFKKARSEGGAVVSEGDPETMLLLPTARRIAATGNDNATAAV